MEALETRGRNRRPAVPFLGFPLERSHLSLSNWTSALYLLRVALSYTRRLKSEVARPDHQNL